MTDPTHWTYTIARGVIDAADRVVNAHGEHGVLACLDDEVRDAVLLVCGTIAGDEAEPVEPMS